MILLVGQVGRRFLGREAFQEVDFVRMFAPLAKDVIHVDSVEALPGAMASAHRTALAGRRGPVVLAFPEDVLSDATEAPFVDLSDREGSAPDLGSMSRLHGLLRGARRPLMLVGGGGWTDRAGADIAAFASANTVPTCCAFRRHDIFDNDHPLFRRRVGHRAQSGVGGAGQGGRLVAGRWNAARRDRHSGLHAA